MGSDQAPWRRLIAVAGLLCLVGGDEFHRGNEPHDEFLRDAAAGRPAFVIATAARDSPDAAVANAVRWFGSLGLEMSELRLRTPSDARSPATLDKVAAAGLFYIAGGDPGRVVRVLRDSRAWQAIIGAWDAGAAVAGSSAGAMALCEWSLVREGFPGHARRRATPALRVVPGSAVLPHYDTFGERWIPSAQESVGPDAVLIGIDERTAAMWRDGSWTAMGAGAVTLVRGDERQRFPAGERIEGIPQPVSR